MAIVEDDALVLRSMRFRDTSRIATLLTRQGGKVHVIAKGARDPKSPFSGALEVLTRSEVVYYLKKSRTLQFLKAAMAQRAYLATLASPRAYLIACAALEFVDRVLPDEDPCPRVFAALERFLEGCERNPRNPRNEARFKAFQLYTVAVMGYAPLLDACSGCGGSVGEPRGFAVAQGGVVCRKCAGEGELLPLSAAGLQVLCRILGLCAPAGVSESGAAADKEVVAVIESFLRYHVTGYRGLQSLRGLLAWQELCAGEGIGGCPPPA